MSTRNAIGSFILALFLAGASNAQSDAPAPEPAQPRLNPDETAAAHAGAPYRLFTAWLEAFNATDAARLRDFDATHFPDGNQHPILRQRANISGLDLRALEAATPTSVTGILAERDSDNFLRFKLDVKAGDPDVIDTLSILYVPRPPDMPLPRMTQAEIFAALDSKLTRDLAEDRFSGAVLVTRHGKVVYGAACGMADREKHVANTLDTRFNLGSMNKMFTATAVMQLVQAGKISLDDPVGKLIADYPNKDVAAKVTVEHLLTHRGGTGDIFGPDYAAHRLELRTHDDYLKLYGARPPAFDPGTRFEYSNYGMVLLGVVIERVTRQSYDDYVARHVFKPAKMRHTGSEPIDALLPHTAVGYMRAEGGGRKPNWEMLSRGTSAGGGYSTVHDLANFAAALMANKLLTPENTQALITGKVDLPYGGKYAYGFEDLRGEAGGYVGHGGGAPGVNGALQILPQSGYVIAVLSNIDPPFAGRVARFLALRLENQK